MVSGKMTRILGDVVRDIKRGYGSGGRCAYPTDDQLLMQAGCKFILALEMKGYTITPPDPMIQAISEATEGRADGVKMTRHVLETELSFFQSWLKSRGWKLIPPGEDE